MKFDIALTRLAMTSPFIASTAMRMQWVYNEDIPTIATDGFCVYYGTWAESLSYEFQTACIAHEALHAMLQHCPMIRNWVETGRGPDGKPYDAQRMNRAMDFLINGSLVEEGFEFPTLPNGGSICLEAGVNLNYDLLTMYCQLEDEGGEGGKASAQGEPLDEHRVPEGREPPPFSPADIAVAAQASEAMSSGESRLIKSVMALIRPPSASPWAMLRDRMANRRGGDVASWKRPNRHLLVRGVIAPSLVSERSEPVGVVVDVSGSCHGRIPEFLGHVASIIQETRAERVALVFVDNVVRWSQEFTDLAEFELIASTLSVPQGGSTDMRVGLDLCQALGYTKMVVLTDGYTPYPKKLDAEIIWAMTTNVKPPLGEVVQI